METQTIPVREEKRGRKAISPGKIPPKGWVDIFFRVKDQVSEDNIGLIAAGIAFYAFLAIFPAIIATITIYGLIVSPETVQQQLTSLTGILPPQVKELLSAQLSSIANKADTTLGWGLLISLVFALWSSNKGMRSVFTGLNIVYKQKQTRGFIKENAITLLFTLGAIFLIILCGALVVGFPAVIGNLGLHPFLQNTLMLGRWPVLAILGIISLATVYRYAPVRKRAKWSWVGTGTVISVFLWLGGSWAFSFYVSNFGNYNKTYGSLAAVVILMLWFMLTGFVILLGAEINSETESQTGKDTTRGKEKPMGRRGAYHADIIGKSH